MKRPTKDSLRKQAEKVLSSKHKEREEDSRPVDKLMHELQVHQIELEMQNDELRQIQARLEEISAKYFDLYQSAPAGYFIFDEKWTILESNLTGSRILGTTQLQIVNKSLHDFINPGFQDTFYLYRRKVLQSGSPENCELKLINNAWVSIESIAVLDEQGHETGTIRAVLTDISERKRMEEALRESRNDLEIKVGERTAQLSETNKSLLSEIEERKRTEKRLRAAQKNLRAISAEIVMADERSRQHFAADLHDTVIQTIGAAKLRSQLIQDDIPEKSSRIFQELQSFISQSITQARFIMAEMSPPVLNELGFIPAMEWLTEQIANQHGINIEFNAADGFTPLQHEIQVLLFQATREFLMNVVKHAAADKVLVKISGGRKKVRIEIIDNGKGFDKRQAFQPDVSSGGYGLFSIRERTRHFGGHLIIQSGEGKGTRVVMTVPRTSGEGTPPPTAGKI